MRITALEVDGYGIWTGLKLDGLSEGLNVLYGPNEAGKTTLMQFVRSVLYGFLAERRRYLPPLRGGRPGGALEVAGSGGRYLISRHQDENQAHFSELVTLSASDGTRQGDDFLNVLLSNVDEAVFNNVFAVGLEELQQLGTLGDTEAASLLYNLTAGLDRVALVDVVKELEFSRNRLLSADGQPCRVSQLVQQREKLRAEIDQQEESTCHYLRLAAERDQVAHQATRLEEETARLEHRLRVVEIATALADRWERRRELDDQLAALGPSPAAGASRPACGGPQTALPEGAVARLDAAGTALAKRQQYAGRLERRREQLQAEAAALKADESLWRLAPRIEALAEQEPWITRLEQRASELQAEIAELEAQWSGEQERLGLSEKAGGEALRSLSTRSLRPLRQPAKTLGRCQERLEKVRQEAAAARQTARSLAVEMDAALAARGQQALFEAMDRSAGAAAKLRRRLQIDERLEQMDRYQVELEAQSRRLLTRQVLPAWTLIGLGGVFVTSVVLVMAGLFMPASVVGSLSWPLALLGLAGLGAATGAKFILERSVARRLEACQRQIGMLQLQIKQAQKERESLNGQLPAGEGPIASRLKAAEKELAGLEELVPLDARRKAAEEQAAAAEGRARSVESQLAEARRDWQESLRRIGLPGGLSPKQVRRLVHRCRELGELRRRLDHRREEYDERCRELEALASRIAQLASEAGLTLPSVSHPSAVDGGGLPVGNAPPNGRPAAPIDQVRALAEALTEQEARLKRRRYLRAKARGLRRKQAKNQAAVRRLGRRRREILRQAGVEDEHELRQLAARVAQAETLRKERESLQREIDAAIAGHCSERAVAEQLSFPEPRPPDGVLPGKDADRARLAARHEELQGRLQAVQAKLREAFEKQGRLSEQLKALADDRSLISRQLERAMVEKRLQEAVHRWQVLATSSRILQSVRTTYEQERQPETLREASGHLERLTQGRYVRVWTPLDRDVLLVDGVDAQSLSVERLSRGAREQLFLALRLALVSCFARRGAQLPVLLDDVLVNFDNRRAKAAVALLRDFAAAGHQVLVFTCHEHLVKMFSSLRVEVSRLPDSEKASPSATAPRKSTRRRRNRKAQPPPGKLVGDSAARGGTAGLSGSAVRGKSTSKVRAEQPSAPDDEPALWPEQASPEFGQDVDPFEEGDEQWQYEGRDEQRDELGEEEQGVDQARGPSKAVGYEDEDEDDEDYEDEEDDFDEAEAA